jgi:hypothetical protein
MTDLRTALLNANVTPPEHRFLYAKGRKHPPYNELGVMDTYVRFKADFLPQCPFTDCLDRQIRIEETHFRKMLNMKHRTLGEKARAYMLVEELEAGTFDPSHYHPLEKDRIRTMFWIAEVLQDPDAVFRNNHRTVKADEVFATVYDKSGSTIKLVFTAAFGPRFNPRQEIVTSYLTDPLSASKCFKGKPLYLRK